VREMEIKVKHNMGLMNARIDPIKKKFEFITDDNFSDIGNVELSDEDKMALASLD
jgi:hypothetical protein